jgi:hypothetical protein
VWECETRRAGHLTEVLGHFLAEELGEHGGDVAH